MATASQMRSLRDRQPPSPGRRDIASDRRQTKLSRRKEASARDGRYRRNEHDARGSHTGTVGRSNADTAQSDVPVTDSQVGIQSARLGDWKWPKEPTLSQGSPYLDTEAARTTDTVDSFKSCTDVDPFEIPPRVTAPSPNLKFENEAAQLSIEEVPAGGDAHLPAVSPAAVIDASSAGESDWETDSNASSIIAESVTPATSSNSRASQTGQEPAGYYGFDEKLARQIPAMTAEVVSENVNDESPVIETKLPSSLSSKIYDSLPGRRKVLSFAAGAATALIAGTLASHYAPQIASQAASVDWGSVARSSSVAALKGAHKTYSALSATASVAKMGAAWAWHMSKKGKEKVEKAEIDLADELSQLGEGNLTSVPTGWGSQIRSIGSSLRSESEGVA